MGTGGRVAAGLAGVALLAGFFLPWIDAGLGGAGQASGLEMALQANGVSPLRVVLALIPLAGLALVAAAVKGGAVVPTVSLVVGLALLGYGVYQVGRSFVAVTGVGLWLVIAAAVVAVVAPLVGRGRPAGPPAGGA